MRRLSGLKLTRTFDRLGIVVSITIAIVVLGFASAFANPTAGVRNVQQQGSAAPTNFGIKLPAGYRDWKFISVARVGPPVNDMRAKLGNDVAMRAFRADKLPFPDGTIIARLAYNQATSEEGNAAVGAAARRQGLGPDGVQKLLSESFVAGPPTNVQFMVKDSHRFAATGGWGFAQFTNGKPDTGAVIKTCFACHAPASNHDFVFTRYSR